MKHIFKVVTIIVFLFTLNIISALSNKNEFSSDKINIIWNITENDIVFTLSAKTTGWIAIGLEPTRMMKDANLIIGYVKDDKLYIEDHFGSGFTSHKADIKLGGVNNVTPISGKEINGKTTIKFSIPLKSGDKLDKDIEAGKKYKVILAYGLKDNIRSMHSYRTSTEIIFNQ